MTQRENTERITEYKTNTKGEKMIETKTGTDKIEIIPGSIKILEMPCNIPEIAPGIDGWIDVTTYDIYNQNKRTFIAYKITQ
jgi:hypothetical protein